MPVQLWTAMLAGRAKASLAVTGGIHTAVDVVKSTMAGTHATQMVSALLKNGPGHLGKVRAELEAWMEENEWSSLNAMRGNMSLERVPRPQGLRASQLYADATELAGRVEANALVIFGWSQATNTRRKLLLVMAGMRGLAGLVLWDRLVGTGAPGLVRRTSRALGAEVTMTALHSSQETAERAISAAFDELELVEEITSLYRPESEISDWSR